MRPLLRTDSEVGTADLRGPELPPTWAHQEQSRPWLENCLGKLDVIILLPSDTTQLARFVGQNLERKKGTSCLVVVRFPSWPLVSRTA